MAFTLQSLETIPGCDPLKHNKWRCKHAPGLPRIAQGILGGGGGGFRNKGWGGGGGPKLGGALLGGSSYFKAIRLGGGSQSQTLNPKPQTPNPKPSWRSLGLSGS